MAAAKAKALSLATEAKFQADFSSIKANGLGKVYNFHYNWPFQVLISFSRVQST